MSHKKKDKEQEKEILLDENKQVDAQAEAEEGKPESTPEATALEQKEEEIRELKDYIQRLAAEFDNYKKRTGKEKEKIYVSSAVDVVAAFLPALDNVELALKAIEGKDQSIRDGIQMIYRQMQDILASLNVKPIEAIGRKFDPELHEAVMHVEDDNYGANEIIEEFRKGYIYKNEVVIRHSVVRVAN